LQKKLNTMKRLLRLLPFAALLMTACTGEEKPVEAVVPKEVNVYSHRHYDIDQEIYNAFEKETGIKVNVVSASADELIVRMQSEGVNSPADLLITSDAGRLVRAQEEGLLQAVTSEALNANIPAHLRDANGEWFALTTRARVIVYSPERVDTSKLTGYAGLADPQWKGRILARSSSNIYNQSLLAALTQHLGTEGAEAWVRGVVANFAREPRGNDRDQITGIAAGEGDLALVNTYYLAKMFTSDNAAEREAAAKVRVFFPADAIGTHLNISGAGVVKTAPNRDNAIALLTYLSSTAVQRQYAEGNFEYPVHPEVMPSDILQEWGAFQADTLPLVYLGSQNKLAVEIFNRAGWN
jgi:iron(III) transport system substrate-binding protein